MNNIFYTNLFDEVNYQTIKDVVADLNEAKMNPEIQKVVITLCSWGGYYYPAFALFDILKSFPKEVEIIATGACQSSALLILQGAKKRSSTKNTVFLIHQTQHNIEDKNLTDVMIESEQYKRESETFAEMTVSKSKLNKEKFKELIVQSKYFSAEEALEMGLIDEIID